MGVKAVHHIKQPGVLRRLHRQVGGTAAAEDQNVNLIRHLHRHVRRVYRNIGCQDFYVFRITPGKNSGKLHIRILPQSAFHTAAQVTVTKNTDRMLIAIPSLQTQQNIV